MGEGTSTLEISIRIWNNIHKSEKQADNSTVSGSLWGEETAAQLQGKNQAVREEENSWCADDILG